jgi:hypothetical protein
MILENFIQYYSYAFIILPKTKGLHEEDLLINNSEVSKIYIALSSVPV